jgi:DNA repair protein RadA/Sms
VFRCSGCGAAAPQWTGRCPGCGSWNTLGEERVEAPAASGKAPPPRPAVPIARIDAGEWSHRPTGLAELDRLLGGGLVPGSVTLLGGEPGIGKSTLLLQMAAARARAGSTVLYVSAEESGPQVKLRAERLGALPDRLWLAGDPSIPNLVAHIDQVRPEVVVVDSIQTVYDPDLASAPGSVGQVRESAHRLVQEAKARDVAAVLVGHVTKDGGLAGPRVLEHLVDTVLSFEGDRHHDLRLLRAVKHRFGPTDDLGLFQMTADGLEPVPDPSALFLTDRQTGISGSVVVPVIEGFRPLLIELQVLLVDVGPQAPTRRAGEGFDSGRLNLLAAVAGERAAIDLRQRDVHALAVGGVKVDEPGADLAVVLALASAAAGTPFPADMVACGEVGLGGEVRQVAQLDRRLAEAARLGFRRALVPASASAAPSGLEVMRVRDVNEAIEQAGLAKGTPTPLRSRPASVGREEVAVVA